jgi:hypothetical protein
MIQIKNIGTTQAAFNTKYGGSSGYPIYFKLEPGDSIQIPRQNLHNYQNGVKQNIVEYVANGTLELRELDSVHIYVDKNNTPSYTENDLAGVDDAIMLTRVLAAAVSHHATFDAHATSYAVHNAVTAAIAHADPTDLATLATYIGAARTAHNAHIADAMAHPHVDASNTVAVGVPAATLVACVPAMQELLRMFTSHKSWVNTMSVPLSILAIQTY